MHAFRLTGTLEPCDACGIAKASQTRISKTMEIKATKPGERIYIDTTGPFSHYPQKHKYLHGALDCYSGKMLAQFSTLKNKMSEFTKKVVSQYEGDKKEVKYIRIDGGGENVAIEKMVKSKGGITIEKTSPHTPQCNGSIERRFPIIKFLWLWRCYGQQDLSRRRRINFSVLRWKPLFSCMILLQQHEVRSLLMSFGTVSHVGGSLKIWWNLAVSVLSKSRISM